MSTKLQQSVRVGHRIRDLLAELVMAYTLSYFSLHVCAVVTTLTLPYVSLSQHRWKSAIASKKAWGEAALLLQQYYYNYGFGITSRNSALRYLSGTRLRPQFCMGMASTRLTCKMGRWLSYAADKAHF